MSASSPHPEPEPSRAFIARTSARRATLDDAARISRLFAASFARDPIFHWLARGGRRRADALQRFFFWVMRERAIPRGETWITSDGYAAAAWIPPFNAARPDNWRDEIRLLSVILSLTGLARLPRGAAMAKAMEHAHPPEPYFYLAFIGVAPRFQGTGLGQGLLEETLARVDAAGTPAFLENSSPRNIPLYERLGFQVTQEIVVRKDAPPLYAMLRPGKNQ